MMFGGPIQLWNALLVLGLGAILLVATIIAAVMKRRTFTLWGLAASVICFVSFMWMAGWFE